MEKGQAVTAIRNTEGDKVYYYGDGVYEGDHHPDTPAFARFPETLKNPKITLSDGKVVWGYECWWGPSDEIKARFPDPFTWIKVDIEEDRSTLV